MKNFYRKNLNGNKGFTLIELLIVIAIIGVLATTVIVSIGSQTGNAGKSSAKLGVSSIRTLAFAETALNTNLTGGTLCNNIYKQISGQKDSWAKWKGTNVCGKGDLVGASGLQSGVSAGEICCYANRGKWIVWGALPDADGTGSGGNDIYCTDYKGFLGSLNGSPASTSGSNPRCK